MFPLSPFLLILFLGGRGEMLNRFIHSFYTHFPRIDRNVSPKSFVKEVLFTLQGVDIQFKLGSADTVASCISFISG